MKNPTKEKRWKERCPCCRKYHLYHIRKCPQCGVYEIPITVSENVCTADLLICDGCNAYKDHLV